MSTIIIPDQQTIPLKAQESSTDENTSLLMIHQQLLSMQEQQTSLVTTLESVKSLIETVNDNLETMVEQDTILTEEEGTEPQENVQEENPPTVQVEIDTPPIPAADTLKDMQAQEADKTQNILKRLFLG